MKNFSRANFASVVFCLAVILFSISANAQTPPAASPAPSAAPSPTDAVPPVTVQAPAQPAANPVPPMPSEAAPALPPPSDGIKMAPNGETPAAATATPAEPAPAMTPKKTSKAKSTAKKPAAHKTAKHHAKKKTAHHAKKSKKKPVKESLRDHVRAAQTNLDTLGYAPGPIDGLLGPKTRTAIKAFQKDHALKVTGKLDDKTFARIAEEAVAEENKKQLAAIQNAGDVAPAPQPPPEFFTKHPDYYGYYNREYANPTQLGSPQAIPSRFGDMQISEQMNGTTRQYVITLNGQPIFHADGQPAVINLSRTFNLDGADAVVLTSYAGGDNTCPYRHYLLVVRLNSNGVHEIGNCSRAYEAYTQSGSLYISFPGQHVDGWASGDTWRYENGTLQRL